MAIPGFLKTNHDHEWVTRNFLDCLHHVDPHVIDMMGKEVIPNGSIRAWGQSPLWAGKEAGEFLRIAPDA